VIGSVKPVASVIIIVKNGMPDIERCLAGVFAQKAPWPFEVLVIDSGSTDGTLDIVRRSGARLIEIPPQSFNHGNTRNLGAKEAEGQYLVFLVADAIPLDQNWLAPLVAAVQEDGVAGAYSRQIPRPEHNLLVRSSVEGWYTFSTTRLVKQYPFNVEDLSPEQRYQLAVFDDVSACMRKDVWERFPYNPVHCEDVEWSNRVLSAGYKIVFEPASVVYHSHQRSVLHDLKRAYVFNRLLYRIFGLDPVPNLWKAIRTWLWSIKSRTTLILQSKEPIREKARLLFYTPVYSATVFGQYLGIKSDRWLDKYPWFKRVDDWFTVGTQ